MTATPLAAFAALAVAALCAFAPGPASAQTRDVFAVAGVHVDETAANAAAAQEAAFASAQRLAFGRLVQRLTLPEQLAATTMPALEGMELDRMVLSVDVEEERRSSTRYIGRLTVRFDPSAVRNYLRNFNLTVIEARTAPILVVPVAAADTPPETAALWRQVWATGGFDGELVPLAVAPETVTGPPAWESAAAAARANAAGSALFATLRAQGATLTAHLVEIDAATRRDRGEATARVNGADAAALRAALAQLAEQANQRIQSEWKARATAGAGQRGRISASALYANQAQWERIKQGLEGAAQTLISEIRIEAVGREGALVSFTFVGDPGQLTAELERRGVRLEQTVSGPVLRAIGR